MSVYVSYILYGAGMDRTARPTTHHLTDDSLATTKHTSKNCATILFGYQPVQTLATCQVVVTELFLIGPMIQRVAGRRER